MIASHDRNFLDACTTRTLFLRPEASMVFNHPYSRARALLAEHDGALASQFDKDRREMRRLRQNAGELRNIGINSGSDLLLRKAKQLGGRADALEQGLQAGHRERSGKIALSNRGTHARVLVSLDHVVVRKPDGERLFEIPRLLVAQGDRIVVLGRNGVGKSRLVGLLRQAMSTPDGDPGVRTSPSVVVGYTDQEMSQLPQGSTAHDFILATYRLGDQRSRSLLAGAGFGVEKQGQPIARLSPGEKARLALLALRLAEPNFYLMDEPTNHVDIAGRERLEAEILASEATCLVVSARPDVRLDHRHAVPARRGAKDGGNRGAGGVLRGGDGGQGLTGLVYGMIAIRVFGPIRASSRRITRLSTATQPSVGVKPGLARCRKIALPRPRTIGPRFQPMSTTTS